MYVNVYRPQKLDKKSQNDPTLWTHHMDACACVCIYTPHIYVWMYVDIYPPSRYGDKSQNGPALRKEGCRPKTHTPTRLDSRCPPFCRAAAPPPSVRVCVCAWVFVSTFESSQGFCELLPPYPLCVCVCVCAWVFVRRVCFCVCVYFWKHVGISWASAPAPFMCWSICVCVCV